jgi:hypothetical protein
VKRRCEAQTGIRPRLWLNAVTIPYAVICPRDARPGSPYCEHHHKETSRD